LLDNNGQVLIPGMGYDIGDQLPPTESQKGVPILVDGQEVGRVLLVRNSILDRLADAEAAFLARVNRVLILSAVGGTAFALLLGILLAQTLTRPLRELTAATKAVAQGDLDQQVPVRSEDELGQLARSFNQMNADLAHSRDIRRQMTADIAHDLRTPVSIILGHSEALSDGVLPARQETFEVIHDEARRLNRLIDDLRTLSLAEAGELELIRRFISPETLLVRAAKAHTPRAIAEEKELTLDISRGLPDVNVDSDRMAQVLDNLVSNAIRYTPPSGVITLSARNGRDGVRFFVQDSGPGIPAEDLPYVFDRFYKGDKSRQRKADEGSGLGLAIARSIVDAHGGRIWAESERGRGVTFVVELPVGQA
jgi:signal transduction histidine kinase